MNAGASLQAVTPLPEEIATAAYYIWQKEGRADGHAAEHWRRAEAQLLARRSRGKAAGCEPPPPPNITTAILKSLPEHKRARTQATHIGRRKVIKLVG